MRCEDYPCCGHTDHDPCPVRCLQDWDDTDDGMPYCATHGMYGCPTWEKQESDDAYRMAQAYGEAPPDPDDGYYYYGTGEWSGDDSYIRYLNS